MDNQTDARNVMLLLYTPLGIPRGSETKPLSLGEFNSLMKSVGESRLQSPGELLQMNAQDLVRELELDGNLADRIENLLSRKATMAMEMSRLEEAGVFAITRIEKEYPPLLVQRLKKARVPPVFFFSGNLGLLEKPAVAVVGSRNAGEELLEYTQKLSRKLVEAGFQVVSGGAKGIDSQAMVTCMENGGSAIGVVADSLLKNTRKATWRSNLRNGELLLLSARSPESPFNVGRAMERNKYIYCLSSYAVVVNSTANKGGTWAGAIENIKNGFVPLFVRSDSGEDSGNQLLAKKGAIPLDNETLVAGNVLGEFLENSAKTRKPGQQLSFG